MGIVYLRCDAQPLVAKVPSGCNGSLQTSKSKSGCCLSNNTLRLPSFTPSAFLLPTMGIIQSPAACSSCTHHLKQDVKGEDCGSPGFEVKWSPTGRSTVAEIVWRFSLKEKCTSQILKLCSLLGVLSLLNCFLFFCKKHSTVSNSSTGSCYHGGRLCLIFSEGELLCWTSGLRLVFGRSSCPGLYLFC